MPETLQPGDRATLEHSFTTEDVAAFARLSGDDNPIHLTPAAGRAAGFEGVVVHGMLVTSLISRLLGTRLPGPGTILLGQEMKYLRPVYPGDPLRATVEVLSVRQDKPIIVLRTWVESTVVVVDGQATVLLRPQARPPGSEPAAPGA
jgi:acyl dehydratase